MFFRRGFHGDGYPFDGAGSVLAHAFFPEFGGDVHMDDSEKWTVDTRAGTNLLQTLAHEIGHSLGLSHSDVRDSIMAPFYRGYEPNLRLSEDDLHAIRALYGPDVPKPTPSPAAPANSGNELCWNSRLDAIFTTSDNATYVFKDDRYWRLTAEAIAPGYPRQVAADWGGLLPPHIDAAFTWQRKQATYIFKGGQYWKYHNMLPAQGYPKDIHEGFPGIPDDIDTAFVWSGNDKIIFMKGAKYWLFDPDRVPHVSKAYPRPVSSWGIPDNIDGAFQWTNRRTYFFKGDDYWRFDDRRFAISKASPSYPRITATWWFGCKN